MRRGAKRPGHRARRYPRFAQLDGSHPFKHAVPDGFVDYRARRRRDGELAYFNFDLAREMGLIPASHPDRLTRELRRAVLDTFCLVIVNEYDYLHKTEVPERDWLPGSYMATRYLQLQHPDKRGDSSGDGRSVWNGCVRNRGKTWDVSSCGTGVTRLCPATSSEQRFFQTGNDKASYGCGTAALEEGISAALMSETFHRNGIPTERVLAVISLPDGLAINVRAARNLLRPSHFFVHLKQGNIESLKSAVDLFVDRQIENEGWPRKRGRARYRYLAEEMARGFARSAATFESEYIFCWMDWDGDNILADGGIIDYGSVRQFGLYHREYRFDDVDRMSTTIPEQRRKARAITQRFAQLRDAILDGERSPLARTNADPILEIFDLEFEATKRRLLLHKLGLPEDSCDSLLRRAPSCLPTLERAISYFERARSSRGPIKVSDGLSWNAVFCIRDLLRELPARLARDPSPLPPEEILEIALSSYASRQDRRPTPHRRRMASLLQRSYLELVEVAARRRQRSPHGLLAEIAARSAAQNQADRITGNGIDYATARVIRNRRRLGADQIYRLIGLFTDTQDRNPPSRRSRSTRRASPRPPLARILEGMKRAVAEHREGL